MAEQKNISLEKIKEQFVSYGIPKELMETENAGGREILVIEMGGKENFPEDCNISICRFSEDSMALQLMVSVIGGLEKDLSEDISRLLPALNSGLRIGNFGLLAEEGFFYLDHAFLADGLSEEMVFDSLIICFELLISAAVGCRELLEPLISRKKSIEEIDPDDFRIIRI